MPDFIWNILFFIVAIGILVTFHEYGHFWVARKCNVKVIRFSIGFGKAIWKRVDKHGTEFVIAAIPLGGYVKMLDERVDDVLPEDKNNTFNSKSVYQRIAIVSAGPIANFLLAIVAFYFVFFIGTTTIKPVIGELVEQSVTERSTLKVNQQIISIGGRKVETWQDINMALVAEIGNEAVEIKTLGLDTQYVSNSLVDLSQWKYQPEVMSAIEGVGIIPFTPSGTCFISFIEKGSPADIAGLAVGDKFTGINGQNVSSNCNDFTKNIQVLPKERIDLTIERANQSLVLEVQLAAINRSGIEQGYLGIGRQREAWPEGFEYTLTYGVFDSIGKGVEKTWQTTRLSFAMLGKLVTGDISAKNLSGPVGIAQGAGNSASYGLVYFLSFIAFFSINLGIFNLLPLPVLDGGHILYYLIELLTGKPVPEKVQEIGFRFGAIALFSLMAFALFNDISRL